MRSPCTTYTSSQWSWTKGSVENAPDSIFRSRVRLPFFLVSSRSEARIFW